MIYNTYWLILELGLLFVVIALELSLAIGFLFHLVIRTLYDARFHLIKKLHDAGFQPDTDESSNSTKPMTLH